MQLLGKTRRRPPITKETDLVGFVQTQDRSAERGALQRFSVSTYPQVCIFPSVLRHTIVGNSSLLSIPSELEILATCNGGLQEQGQPEDWNCNIGGQWLKHLSGGVRTPVAPQTSWIRIPATAVEGLRLH